MFCYQCEQAAKGTGCEKQGVCGKTPEVASLQDLLIHSLKGLAVIACEGRKFDIEDAAINEFTYKAVFSTLTNVDFDPERLIGFINQTEDYKESLKKRVGAKGGKVPADSGTSLIKKMINAFTGNSGNGDFTSNAGLQIGLTASADLVAAGEKVGIPHGGDSNPDIVSLQQLLIYGVKGLAAYADHALILGQKDDAIAAFIHEALAATTDTSLGVDELVGLSLKCGEVNIRGLCCSR